MRRRSTLASLGTLTLLLAAALASPAISAPAGPEPGPAPTPASGAFQGDADGDRLADDLEAQLGAASSSDRLEVIVEGARPGRARELVGSFDLAVDLPLIDGFAATMSAGQIRALARKPGVQRISTDGVVRALDDAGNRDFGVDDARLERPAVDGSGIGICVVDTGVHPTHEQLAGRVAGFFDAVNRRAEAYDDHGHGTHVAAIAAGAGPVEYRGVAPGALIYAAKVLSSAGSGSDSQVIDGVSWCAEQSAVQVISMSLGDTTPSDGTDPLSNAVNAAVLGDSNGDGVADRDGDVVVVAAGNSGDAPGTINAPGVAANAITVGAVSDHSAPVATARRDDGIWLAAFSSRGPARRPGSQTAVKPDVVAPGVTVTAAKAGTTSGYVTMSGTSMATPFVAGATALALEADPGTTPNDVKLAIMQTAADRGGPGVDNEWGAGLLDVRALVDAVAPAGSTPVSTGLDGTAFPTSQRLIGSVGRYATSYLDIVVPAGASGAPLVVMLTVLNGQLNCDLYCLIGFTVGEWSPDIDMELLDSTGAVVADSQCTLSGVTCAAGRQETLTVHQPVAGTTYRLRVYEWSGSVGSGADFVVDVSRGPLAGTAGGDGGSGGTQPPPNQAPIAEAGADQVLYLDGRRKIAFSLDGNSSRDDSGIVGWQWRLGNKTVGTSATLSQTKGVGDYTYTLKVTDAAGLTDTDAVTVTVRR